MNSRVKKIPISLVFLVLLGFGLRLAAIDQQSLWWDELKTWERATLPLNEMIADLIDARAHLPLYFWLMRLWVRLGTDAFVLRLFSAFLGTLSLPLIYQIGRKFGRSAGLLAALLLAVSPFHIWYSQEARMYTLLPAALLLAHLQLLRAVQKNELRWWATYGLSLGAAIFTHYFAFFVVMAHYIFLVLHYRNFRQQTRGWFLTVLTTGLIFVPWVWVIVTSSAGYSTAVPEWIEPIRWYDPLLTVWVFANGSGIPNGSWLGILGIAAFLWAIGAAACNLISQNRAEAGQPTANNTLHLRLLFLWFLTPILVTFLVSLDWSLGLQNSLSIYNDRYLIVSLPAFLLLSAWGFETLFQRRTGQILFALLLSSIVLVSGYSIAQQASQPAYARNDWQAAIAYANTSLPSTNLFLGRIDLWLPVHYYGDERLDFVQLPPPETDQITPSFEAVLQKQLSRAADSNQLAWHVEIFYNFNPHGFPRERSSLVASEEDSLTKTWLKSRFILLDEVNLPGIRMALYDISAAKQ